MEDEPRRIPELRTDVVFLFDLVKQIASGRIRIPRFQRSFVWRRDQMIDLLDSINRQYPIGSLLAWDTGEEIATLERIGPLRLDLSGKGSAYLLDGHQRASTIAGALVGQAERDTYDDEDPARWAIYYNSEDNAFEHLDFGAAPGPAHFPMSKLLDTFDFLEESARLLAADPLNGRRNVERVQAVARAFQNYKIPVIQIRQTDLSEAVEIFARLNSRGQAMTSDQMVSAMLYRQGDENHFDLATEISETVSMLDEVGFGGVDRTVVLRALLAAVGEDIYRTDWTRIAQSRRNDLLSRLSDVLPRVKQSLRRAANFLRSDLGVANNRLLPYSMQLVVISSFFLVAPQPNGSQIALLRRWFWVSSFCMWFNTANPSRVNALVKDVIENVAASPDKPEFKSVRLDVPAEPIPRSFDMRGARTRTLLLVLLSKTPLDKAGDPIAAESMIELSGPAAVNYVDASIKDSELSRSPANRIFAQSRSDRNQAKSWLTGVSPQLQQTVWASHCISPDAIHALRNGDAAHFVARRLDEFVAEETAFMNKEGVRLPGL